MNDAFAKSAGNTMALTVNVHGSSVELLSVDESRLVAGHGSGEYLPNGVDRLLDLFSRSQLKATFFVPGREAERNPSLIREIAAEGHEIAANGYQFEDFSKGADQDHEVLKRSHDILASCVGIAPIGWRAPKGLLSAATLKSLASFGYVYDSS
ncbi:polysaccharide deacetylase family protein, partial [Bradyrhizobium ottawaense]|uniref:polysaccharide deacetylase family protein n=1 Tax=Bradyrhizobium ottawaense TaxID=931866 RepID=UPI0015CF4A52